MTYTFASATILLLLITDPFGSIPIFANALRNVAPERRTLVIVREVLIAFLLLLTFMFIGDAFLRVMNLSGLSLQIAGGVILFLIALRMVFPPPDAQSIDVGGHMSDTCTIVHKYSIKNASLLKSQNIIQFDVRQEADPITNHQDPDSENALDEL